MVMLIFLTTIASQEKKSKINKTLSPNILYLNNGDGTFKDVSKQFKIDKNNFSTPASLETLIVMVFLICL